MVTEISENVFLVSSGALVVVVKFHRLIDVAKLKLLCLPQVSGLIFYATRLSLKFSLG